MYGNFSVKTFHFFFNYFEFFNKLLQSLQSLVDFFVLLTGFTIFQRHTIYFFFSIYKTRLALNKIETKIKSNSMVHSFIFDFFLHNFFLKYIYKEKMNDVAIITGVIIILITFGIIAYVVFKKNKDSVSSNFGNFKFVKGTNEADVTSTKNYITVGKVDTTTTPLNDNYSVSSTKIVVKNESNNYVVVFGVPISNPECTIVAKTATIKYTYNSKNYTILIGDNDLGSSVDNEFMLHIQNVDFTTKNIEKVASNNVDSKYWYRYKTL